MKKINASTIKKKGNPKKIVYALDWNAEYYKDRYGCVKDLEERGMLDGLSPSQLNEVANYLLYSCDVDCEVKLRKPTKKMVSYEDLVDEGVADMALNNSKYKNVYKVNKPFIDKEKDKDIPGIQDLWVEMAKVKEVYDYLDDCLKGRREPDFNNPLKITYVNHHFYKNWYIDLCLQQYTLKDAYKGAPQSKLPETYVNRKENVYEFGIKVGPYVLSESDEDKMIDLANPKHIYLLLKKYREVKTNHLESTIDDWNVLYDLLDRAISRANLDDCLFDVLERKINGIGNVDIRNYVLETYGHKYNFNYISTLFTGVISKKIADAAVILIKRDKHETEQKECSKCKEKRWMDEYANPKNKICGYCRHKLDGVGRKIKIWR